MENKDLSAMSVKFVPNKNLIERSIEERHIKYQREIRRIIILLK